MNTGMYLIFLGVIPVFAAMVASNNFGTLTGADLWTSLAVALAIGAVAAITAVGSGLNTYGTFLAFTASFATVLYLTFVAAAVSLFSSIPYGLGAILGGFSLFCYVVGLYAVLTSSTG
jgi:hypothetical protein